MTDSPLDQATLDWVCESAGASDILGVTTLVGGLSRAMFRIDLRDTSVVLRHFPEDGPWQRDCVRREAAALRQVEGAEIAAPTLIASDPEGTATGTPSTLMTLLPGEIRLGPHRDRLTTMATTLVRLHDLAPGPEIEPVHWFADLDDDHRLRWLVDRRFAAEALALAATAEQPRSTVFVHGDYQHFNLLWAGTRISGVIDWPMSGLNERARDVGHCMLNLAVLHSAEEALDFLDHYEQQAATRLDEGWLVREVLDFGPEWQEFIPIQVAGRTGVDPPGMPDRVATVVETLLRRAG